RYGPGRRGSDLPAARLAGEPAAVLGRTDPDRLLRAARRTARAGAGAAGPAAVGGRLRTDRGQPARLTPRVPGRHLPGRWWARASRDRHHGHLRGFVVVLPALHLAPRPASLGSGQGQAVDAG